eukprot:symbB.v1.2.005239.t1/scaffold302.1/size234775/8
MATHCGKTILCFRRADGGRLKHAAHVVLANRLETSRNLLLLNFDFAPLEVSLVDGLVRILQFFQRSPECPEHSAGSPVEWQELDSKELKLPQVVDQVYAQIPELMILDLYIASPVLVVPADEGSARFGLGHLHLTSTEACSYDRMDLNLDLKETSLRAVSSRGARFNVVNPLQLKLHIQYQLLADETQLNIHGHVGQVMVSLAPQAVQILLASCAIGSLSSWQNCDEFD